MLVVYNTTGRILKNLKIINTTNYVNYWMGDTKEENDKVLDNFLLGGSGKKILDDKTIMKYNFEHGFTISGTLNGKKYKYLKSWRIGEKGIPHFDDNQPSWWKIGRKEITKMREKRLDKDIEPFKKMKKAEMIKYLGVGYGSLKSKNKTQLLEFIKNRLKGKLKI